MGIGGGHIAYRAGVSVDLSSFVRPPLLAAPVGPFTAACLRVQLIKKTNLAGSFSAAFLTTIG
jgi:hypothetical protein